MKLRDRILTVILICSLEDFVLLSESFEKVMK